MSQGFINALPVPLTVALGGTGVTTSTGTGSTVLNDTPSLVTPVLGAATGTSLNLGASTTITGMIDDDTFATASASTAASSESIKAYADALTGPYDISVNAGFTSAAVAEDIVVQNYAQLVMARTGSFTGESGYIDTAPTGAAAIVDVLKNGTTIYTTKPQFAISSNTLTAGTLKTDGTEDFVAGDRITFGVTQIGSTEPGEGLRFTILGTV